MEMTTYSGFKSLHLKEFCLESQMRLFKSWGRLWGYLEDMTACYMLEGYEVGVVVKGG